MGTQRDVDMIMSSTAEILIVMAVLLANATLVEFVFVEQSSVCFLLFYVFTYYCYFLLLLFIFVTSMS